MRDEGKKGMMRGCKKKEKRGRKAGRTCKIWKLGGGGERKLKKNGKYGGFKWGGRGCEREN